MQELGEADFTLRWGVLRVGGFFAVLSAISAIFDFLQVGAVAALIGFSVHILFSAVGGAVIGYGVWRWYEYSSMPNMVLAIMPVTLPDARPFPMNHRSLLSGQTS
jgi:hypothetical protein